MLGSGFTCKTAMVGDPNFKHQNWELQQGAFNFRPPQKWIRILKITWSSIAPTSKIIKIATLKIHSWGILPTIPMPQSTADPQVEFHRFFRIASCRCCCAFEFGIVPQFQPSWIDDDDDDDDDDESQILNFECSVRLRNKIVRAEHKLIPEKFKPWPCFNMS